LGTIVQSVCHYTPLFSDDFRLTRLDRIANHPSLNFTIVVNPSSGPGNGAGPDANYTREIPRLNGYANVRTFGYVSTNYAKRDLSMVLRDISTYSAWSENSTFPGLGMHGIFFDETSSQYEPANAQFFETIASAVRSETGLGSNPLVSCPLCSANMLSK
jgi:Spherulation-specific family 4